MRNVLISGLVALTALVLAGCTQAPREPTVVADPKVETVQEGTPSPLDTDRYLIAARDAYLGLAIAYNAVDFSVEQFTSTHSEESAKSIYDGFVFNYVTHKSEFLAVAGPAIWLPVSVVENDAGTGAEVTVCDDTKYWVITKAFPEPTYDLSQGVLLVITVGQDANGGLVEEDEKRSTTECDATGATVERFVPAPERPTTPPANGVPGPVS